MVYRPFFFNGLTSDNYYIAIRHRNHLGAMTAVAPVLGTGIYSNDFTTATTYGADAQRLAAPNVYALWSGNGNGDNKIKYQGSGNDVNTTLSQVLNYPGSGFNYNFDLAVGYYSGDFNMDGKVKYQGSSNDANTVLSSVLNHPGNLGAFAYNYDLLVEQLP